MACKTLASLLALTLSAGGLPWAPAGARAEVAGDRIVLTVTVKDARGNLVDGIRAEEFRVLEDDVEQKVESFTAEGYPLSAVVVMDRALTPKMADAAQKSAGAIAGAFTEFDEVAIGMFETFYEPALGFSSNNDHIQAKLKELPLNASAAGRAGGALTSGPRINGQPVGTGVPGGPRLEIRRSAKNLDDAIFSAAQLLQRRDRARRKILFVVSDGKNSRQNQTPYEAVLKRLLTDDVAVFGVVVGGVSGEGGGLARYAAATGGDVFYASSREEMEGAYGRITEQARNPYTLTYMPREPDRKKEFHSVEVKIKRTGLTIAVRGGYFLPKESDTKP